MKVDPYPLKATLQELPMVYVPVTQYRVPERLYYSFLIETYFG